MAYGQSMAWGYVQAREAAERRRAQERVALKREQVLERAREEARAQASWAWRHGYLDDDEVERYVEELTPRIAEKLSLGRKA